jgi:hypothetical protein
MECMRIDGNSDLGQQVSRLNEQLDQASQLLGQLGKLGEEETLTSDIGIELLQFLVSLLEEQDTSKSAKISRPATKSASKSSSIAQSGPAGFLWKPVSDSDGKLAVLLPTRFTGQVASVSILSPSGQLMERGRNTGVGNGGREHFRFSRPGSAFPPESIVEITLRDGTKQRITIDAPAKRIESK